MTLTFSEPFYLDARKRPEPSARLYALEAAALGRLCWDRLDARRRRLVEALEASTWPANDWPGRLGVADALLAACLPVLRGCLPEGIDTAGREALRRERAAAEAWHADPGPDTEEELAVSREYLETCRRRAWRWLADARDRVEACRPPNNDPLRAFVAELSGLPSRNETGGAVAPPVCASA